jgi:rSAM/selenodomain-associated transferase 2
MNTFNMNSPPTLSVVIPTLNAARTLPATLAALRGGVDDIVVADGGSSDDTVDIARVGGATVAVSERGRGIQLRTGAEAAACDWLLFLHADTRLQESWRHQVEDFTTDPDNRNRAAVFAFALDDASAPARRVEKLVAWRCRLLGLPYGDQGLLISRAHYDALGGFRPMPLMEDVDIVRRIGKKNLTVLSARAVTSAERYRRDGWWRRPVRNLLCLFLYFTGVPPRILEKIYL